MSWVKGHATDEHVRDGRVSARDQAGNHLADQAADDGVRAHGEGVLALAQWLAKRHECYALLVARIHKFILAILAADKELREHNPLRRPVPRPSTPPVVPPTALHYAEPAEARRLQLSPLPPGPHVLEEHAHALQQVHAFLARTSFATPSNTNEVPGSTWLELLIAFEEQCYRYGGICRCISFVTGVLAAVG